MSVLVSQRESTLKLCFFIDGLDEFEGYQQDLLNLITGLAMHGKAKVCLSSRPLPSIEKRLKPFPKLQLQYLTQKDIRCYVHGKLVQHSALVSLKKIEPARTSSLIDEIVHGAAGVFLWVSLTVNDILEGLDNCDGLKELEERIQVIPSTLEEMFERILSRINKIYQRDSARYFQLVLLSDTRGLRLGEMYMADDQARQPGAILMSHERHGSNELRIGCDRMTTLIAARTGGLLETHGHDPFSPTKRVHWLHRTAHDFFLYNDYGKAFLASAGGEFFRLRMCLVKAQLIGLIQFPGRDVFDGLMEALDAIAMIESNWNSSDEISAGY